jgi:hypothetical protein
MGVGAETQPRSFALRVSDYLQEIDYRVVRTAEERDEVFRLRYDAYLREGAIEENASRRFFDDYDRLDNCWIFAIHDDDGRLLSSIRFHVISKQWRRGPALDVFPDIVGPMIEQGKVLIDPTRFVADAAAMRDNPELPYITLRVATMASEYFEADYCLATVRAEHRAFYRRVFESTLLCEPRPYPTLTKPICLMSADVRAIRDRLMQRYPVFLSSFTERRMLLERPELESGAWQVTPRLVAKAQ